LHDIWAGTGAFATVLRKATWGRRSVPIIEAPGTEDIQAGFLAGCKAFLNIRRELRIVNSVMKVEKCAHFVEGKVVSIASRKMEVFAIKLECVSFCGNEAFFQGSS
jgi:hypothetical protein